MKRSVFDRLLRHRQLLGDKPLSDASNKPGGSGGQGTTWTRAGIIGFFKRATKRNTDEIVPNFEVVMGAQVWIPARSNTLPLSVPVLSTEGPRVPHGQLMLLPARSWGRGCRELGYFRFREGTPPGEWKCEGPRPHLPLAVELINSCRLLWPRWIPAPRAPKGSAN